LARLENHVATSATDSLSEGDSKSRLGLHADQRSGFVQELD
jgi:hypothetical protein